MPLPPRRQTEQPGALLPRMVTYVLTNAAVGALVGLGLAVLLMLTNAGGLGSLIHDTVDPVTPVLLVLLGFATLFGGLNAAAAIMMMPSDE